MSQFDEVQLPVKASLKSRGGPRRKTNIVILGSGDERRNARWTNSRRRYSINFLRSDDDINALITFWEARNACLIGFRLKDWLDYKSCPPLQNVTATDQIIGTGSGTHTTFQLIKTYTSGPSSWVRKITKPVGGTVRISFNNIEQSAGSFTVDTTTGQVSCSPPAGQTVKAGFEFDVPSRFDTDDLDNINWADAKAGNVDIPIIELPT